MPVVNNTSRDVRLLIATESHLGKPRYYNIWFTADSGQRRLELARLVVRMLGGAVYDFVSGRCMKEVPSIPDCALKRSKCRRMVWNFAGPEAEWPDLVRMPQTSVLRLEHVVVDFQDLGDRRGLRAVPSSTPDTVVKRRTARLFTNVSNPFTSRVLNPKVSLTLLDE